MAICPKCGKFIGDDLYCKSCGANRFARPERAKETGQSTQHRPLKTDGWTGEPKSSNSGTAVALFLAVVLLSLGGIGILMISEGNTSHIAVYVYSTESMEVDVEISIDGESKVLYEGVLFGYNYSYTASYYENIKFPIQESSKEITVTAKAIKDGVVISSDTKTLVVEKNGSHYVELNV